MTSYLLAGGGTAGHVNPLLAIADEIKRREPDAHIVVVGTKEGLESTLVPERGYELHTIEKLPFPRRPDSRAVRFVKLWRRTVADLCTLIIDRQVDVVVGVGGYVAAPAYSAAKRLNVPLVIHEANARAGLANRRAARWTPYVGVAFERAQLPHQRVVGMPLRSEIATLDVAASREGACERFGLSDDRPTLLVTGGSLGSRSINEAVVGALDDILRAGIQVLHITGSRAAAGATAAAEMAIARPGYVPVEYCSDMHNAFAVASAVIARAGASTVSELCALGIPAIYVPYASGNGEQTLNAQAVVDRDGALLVADRDFTSDWIRSNAISLLSSTKRLDAMSARAALVGIRDGAARMVDFIGEALSKTPGTPA